MDNGTGGERIDADTDPVTGQGEGSMKTADDVAENVAQQVDVFAQSFLFFSCHCHKMLTQKRRKSHAKTQRRKAK